MTRSGGSTFKPLTNTAALLEVGAMVLENVEPQARPLLLYDGT